MSEAIIHGIILAFGLILPLGVQNVFVFNVGARQPSFIKMLPVILTAALCDTILILTAVFGVSLIVKSFSWLITALLVIGFLFLLYMGWVIWNSKSNEEAGSPELSIRKQILFAASVSLLNPHAIVDTIGIIGTNALSYVGNEKWAFTAATIIVSYAWFFSLAIAGRSIGKLDRTGKWNRSINKISAVLIWAIALYLLSKLVV